MLSRLLSLCLGVALPALTLPLAAQSTCSFPSTVPSLLPNPSMEQYDAGQYGCSSRQPNGLPDQTNQANCMVGWQRNSSGTTDAWNAFTLPGYSPGFPSKLPQPLPSGSSVAGFWVGINDTGKPQFRNGDRTWAERYREYLSACFEGDAGLSAGLDYRVTFFLGFMEEEPFRYLGRDVSMASPSGVEIAVYGVRECEQLDFGRFYDCPEASGAEGYELLGTVTVDGTPGSWTAASIDFIAPNDYAGFAIGGSCADDLGRPDTKYFRNYYFIDDVIVNRTEVFEAAAAGLVAGPVAVDGQSMCSDAITLIGQARDGATYQWNHDGTPIAGATAAEYRFATTPEIDGDYTLQVTTAAGCATTEPVRIQRPVIHDQFPDSVALCGTDGAVTIFPSQQSAGTYTWEDGSTNSYRSISAPGEYAVTVSSACVQRVETFTAVETPDVSYRYTMTPERPCAGDTVQLMLESEWYTPLVIFSLPNGERHYVSANTPIEVVAGEVDAVEAMLISSCTTYTDTVAITVLPPFLAEAAVTDVNCHGPEGRIGLSHPANRPAAYRWADPEGNPLPSDDDGSVRVDRAGLYTLVMDGAENCTTTFTAEVGDAAFTAEVLTTDVSCGDDGAASVMVSGGQAPYAVQWLAEADQPAFSSGAVANALPRGSYLTRVRDAAGCETTAAFRIDGPEPLRMQTALEVAGCYPEATAKLQVTATGGTAPYAYAVSGLPVRGSGEFNGLPPGDYAVHVVDALNCTSESWDTTVTLPTPVAVSLIAPERINLGSYTTLDLQLSGIGPEDALIFWDAGVPLSFPDGPLRAYVTPEGTETISVDVVTPDDCTYSDSVSISTYQDARTFIPTAFSPNGDGTNDRLELYANVGVEMVEHFRVFDRWGGLVFEEVGKRVAWDGTYNGKPLDTGTYFYEGSVRLQQGNVVPVRGTVLLMR